MSRVLQVIPQWEYAILAAVFGALWGSFANVVILRWPREMSVVKPASHCFSCKTPIAWYDNIPIISYLVLRGRCRHCGESFSPTYMLVELCMGILSLAIFEMTFLARREPSPMGLAEYFIWFSFAWALVTVAMIDLEHYLIPDTIALPGVVLGILANAFLLRLGYVEPIIASVVGYAGLRLLFIDGYKLLTGKYGMGLGDAKLIAMVGAFTGYEGVLFTLFAGAMQGLVVGGVLVLARRRDGLQHEPVFEEELGEDGEPSEAPDARFGKARVPFGPFLALGAIQYLFIGQWFIAGYTNFIGDLILGI